MKSESQKLYREGNITESFRLWKEASDKTTRKVYNEAFALDLGDKPSEPFVKDLIKKTKSDLKKVEKYRRAVAKAANPFINQPENFVVNLRSLKESMDQYAKAQGHVDAIKDYIMLNDRLVPQDVQGMWSQLKALLK